MPPDELAETFRRCASRLLLIARAIGEPAEDAVQEAFLQLARQSNCPSDPFGWLVRVARNQLLQWHRSGDRRRRRERAIRTEGWFDSIDQLESTLDGKEVTDALADLDPDQRHVLVMHLWGEMTFDDIAEVLGISRSTAHRIFQSGIQTMRRRFHPTPDSFSGAIADE